MDRATPLIDVQTEHIRAVLERTNGRVRGTGGAAELLGVKPTTLESRMTRLGITRESVRSAFASTIPVTARTAN